MRTKTASKRSDWVGIGSASLCTVHCLLTPLVISLSGIFEFWHDFTPVFLIVSAYAVYSASRHTVQRRIRVLLWGSFALLVFAILFEERFEWAHPLSYLASVGLIGGHVWNIVHRRSCDHAPSNS